MKTIRGAGAAIVLLSALLIPQLAVAQSGSLSMSGYAYPSALTFNVTGINGVGAGGFNASYDQNFSAPPAATSFVAYCIDLAQTFSWNGAFSVVQTNVSSLFGTFRADALDRLYTQHFAEANTPTLSAAFQLAVWEIATETSATALSQLGLGSGNFRVTSGNSTAISTANSWLQGLGNGGSGGYTLTALVSSTNQDQMMATPVPEPETYVMLLAGLGLMGFVARRRQQRSLPA